MTRAYLKKHGSLPHGRHSYLTFEWSDVHSNKIRGSLGFITLTFHNSFVQYFSRYIQHEHLHGTFDQHLYVKLPEYNYNEPSITTTKELISHVTNPDRIVLASTRQKNGIVLGAV